MAPSSCTHKELVGISNHSEIQSSSLKLSTPLLSYQPYRLSKHVRYTVPLTIAKFAIVGRRDGRIGGLAAAWRDILNPFETKAWIVTFLFFCALLVLTVYVSSDQQGRTHWEIVFAHDEYPNYSHNKNSTVPNDNFARNNKTCIMKMFVPRRLISISWICFFTIVLIFYELALVEFIVNQTPNVLNLSKVSGEELSSFAVRRDTATETIFWNMVDPQRKYNNDTIPWKRTGSIKEIFGLLENRSAGVKYGLMHEYLLSSELHSRQSLCDSLEVWNVLNEAPYFLSAFFMTKAVSVDEIDAINREISELHQFSRIQEINKQYNHAIPERCYTRRQRIDEWYIVGAMIPIIFLVMLIIFFLRCTSGHSD